MGYLRSGVRIRIRSGGRVRIRIRVRIRVRVRLMIWVVIRVRGQHHLRGSHAALCSAPWPGSSGGHPIRRQTQPASSSIGVGARVRGTNRQGQKRSLTEDFV